MDTGADELYKRHAKNQHLFTQVSEIRDILRSKLSVYLSSSRVYRRCIERFGDKTDFLEWNYQREVARLLVAWHENSEITTFNLFLHDFSPASTSLLKPEPCKRSNTQQFLLNSPVCWRKYSVQSFVMSPTTCVFAFEIFVGLAYRFFVSSGFITLVHRCKTAPSLPNKVLLTVSICCALPWFPVRRLSQNSNEITLNFFLSQN